MEQNIQISIKGLPEEQGNKLALAVGEIIKAFANGNKALDFRRMHRLIVAADYSKELSDLSPLTASGNQINYTSEDYAVGVAKVIILSKEEDDYEIVPVFNAYLTQHLYQEDDEGYSTEDFLYNLHLFHHELCHVHDNNKKIDAFHNLMLSHQHKGKDKYLFPLAEVCWSEYIANHLSSGSATENNLNDIAESLSDAIVRTKSEIDKEILSYRTHGDLDELLNHFRRHGEFLIKTASYTLGYMDGLNLTLKQLSPEAFNKLSGSYFEKIWDSLHKTLKEMKDVYHESWKDLTIYNELSNVINDYYKVMGFTLINHGEDDVYVDIP